SSYMLRGARAGNGTIMAPGYEVGFGFLRGVAIDQHVVARDRLPDLADSLMPRRPDLLGISEDEGTAWIVQGDTAVIMGRNKAFVYGGRDATDSGAPFLTLRPGDRYDLAARRVTRRAIEDSPLTIPFVDSLFRGTGNAGEPIATVLVARDGKVLVNKSYGIPPQPRYMPTTTVPAFALGDLSDTYLAIAAQLAAREGRLSLDDRLDTAQAATVRDLLSGAATPPNGRRQLVALLGTRGRGALPTLLERRMFAAIGAHRTTIDSTGELHSSVDELYRWALGLDASRTFVRDTSSEAVTMADAVPLDTRLGWRTDRYRGETRVAAYGRPEGRQHALVRLPEQRTTIILLTSGSDVDAKGIAERITDRLLRAR
ncbi:MAG: peptidase dipeptidase, partial [Gemmatimonadetes bacterium]|nr:peptidase dipeptidase [Gemmatimonadota bacterium]